MRRRAAGAGGGASAGSIDYACACEVSVKKKIPHPKTQSGLRRKSQKSTPAGSNRSFDLKEISVCCNKKKKKLVGFF